MGHPFVKKFTEERELTVMLVVDAAASERFGTAAATKLETAAEIAALLAFSAIRNNDRVGLLLFTDRVERFVPPRKGRKHGCACCAICSRSRPRGTGTDLARRARGPAPRRDEARGRLPRSRTSRTTATSERLRVVNRKHDLVAIAISDPRESALPAVGTRRGRGSRDGATGPCSTPGARACASAYADRARRPARARARETLKRTGVDFLELSTGEPYDDGRSFASSASARGARRGRGG